MNFLPASKPPFAKSIIAPTPLGSISWRGHNRVTLEPEDLDPANFGSASQGIPQRLARSVHDVPCTQVEGFDAEQGLPGVEG